MRATVRATYTHKNTNKYILVYIEARHIHQKKRHSLKGPNWFCSRRLPRRKPSLTTWHHYSIDAATNELSEQTYIVCAVSQGTKMTNARALDIAQRLNSRVHVQRWTTTRTTHTSATARVFRELEAIFFEVECNFQDFVLRMNVRQRRRRYSCVVQAWYQVSQQETYLCTNMCGVVYVFV